jgi:hypothetical protein
MIKYIFFLFIAFPLSAHVPRVEQYLMSDKHAAKKTLDAIFSPTYVLASQETLKEAGFLMHKPRDPRQLIAAKHPFLPGYLIKVFLDTHSEVQNEGMFWIDRIIGARLIQRSIDEHHYNHLMKVPQKWIYALPNPGRRKYVLVVENMNLLSPAKNQERYQKKIDKEHLDALYTILTENLLIDSVYIDNIPFCTDGKIAFVDTEHFQTMVKPLLLGKLLPKLSKEMQEYWKTLMREYK